jgi:2-oxoglutarate ferredoxin oxidoreductase subunit alpha
MSGKYPHVTGLEHDEWGHPSGNAKMHQKMTDKRRNKLVELSKKLPLPEVYGDSEGDLLLISWGSNYGQIKESVNRLRAEGHKVGAANLRHVHPMPAGMDKLWAGFKKVAVVELNDVGMYGYGQLAMMLRAAYADPKIQSICKTDGLTFRIREIVTGAEKIMSA